MDYINETQFNQIKNLLESKIKDFRNGGKAVFYPSMNKLGGQQMSDLAKCIYNSSVWKTNEESDSTAMFPHYRKHNENPKWNIGAFGSVWMDCVIDGDGVRLACYYDLKTGQYCFKIDALDGEPSVYMHVQKGYPKGSSNFTPKKKKRK